ncbi:hypothetical protein [Chlorobium phaeobacteroides]|jgi:hypothetical protein|uniref:hypothetical protein n=1 Tax=Chlorobium phaeobacteroides TaxID=1096 RepID=UPI001CBDBDC9|nr:hypothetical protein [Chlorobium phaeobacteroides]
MRIIVVVSNMLRLLFTSVSEIKNERQTSVTFSVDTNLIGEKYIIHTKYQANKGLFFV